MQLFPGLIYRMMKPKVVLLIFVSGKIVLTGAKVREEIYMAFNQIYSVLVGESSAARRARRRIALGRTDTLGRIPKRGIVIGGYQPPSDSSLFTLAPGLALQARHSDRWP